MNYNDIRDPQKQDEYLAALMKKQFDQELKEKWAKQLKTEYGLNPTAKKVSNRPLIRRLFPYVGGIAACILIFFAYQYGLQNDRFDANTYLLAEINNPIAHPGNAKGVADDNEARQAGITQFNKQVFEEAAQSFSQIEEKNIEDQFYQAMSFFYLRQSDKAIAMFENLLTKQSNFSQEIRWYLSLAYLDSGDLEAAKKSLAGIKKTEFKFKDASQLLRSL